MTLEELLRLVRAGDAERGALDGSVMAPGRLPETDASMPLRGAGRGVLEAGLSPLDVTQAGVNRMPGVLGMALRATQGGRGQLPSEAAAGALGLAGSGEGYEAGRMLGNIAAPVAAKAALDRAPDAIDSFMRRGGLLLDAAPAGKKAAKQAGALDPMPEMGTRYPAVAPGVPTVDPKTGKPFIQKVLSEEAQQVQKRRIAAQKAIDAGDYEPYFDVTKRQHVDPSNYRLAGDSQNVMPKKQATIDKYRAQVDTPEVRARLDAAYERGALYPGARDWYAMKQLEDEFVKELGPEAGRAAFKERFADPMAATTGGADPTSNLMMGHYGNFQRLRGQPVPEAGHEMPFPIGGRYVSGNMEMYRKFAGGPGFGEGHPKRMNFSGNFLGYQDRATIDEQMMDLFHPGQKVGAPPGDSYGVYEGVVRDLAAKRGVPASGFQDVAWAGGKVAKDPSFQPRPMIGIVNEAIERTHRITGLPKEEIVRRGLVRGEIPLYGVGALGIGLGASSGGSEYQ